MTPEVMNPLLTAALPRLRAAAYRLTRRAQEVDDLVQATALKALANAHLFEERRGVPFEAWARTIMRNIFRTEHRRPPFVVARGALSDLPDQPSDGPPQDTHMTLIEVTRRMRLLSAFRRSLVLRAALGGSVKASMAAFNIPRGTVLSNLNRSRAFLAEGPGTKQRSAGV